MKKNKIIGLSLVLLFLVVIYASTYAYYMRVVNGTISANTGAFTFDVLHNNATFKEINLYDTMDSPSVVSSDKVIVPGDKGKFDLVAKATNSSVDIEYTIGFKSSNIPSNMKFYLDENKTKVLDIETNTINGFLDVSSTSSKTHSIYWEWPYDSGRYNDLDIEYANKSFTVDVTTVGKQSKDGIMTYGIKRNTNSTSTAWERIEDSIGLEANANLPESSTTVANTNVKNDFDNIYPWSEIKSYNYNANTRKVTAWYGDSNFKFDGSNGEVLTYIPGFYYKREVVNGVEYQYISKYEQEGYSYSEPFSVGRYKMSESTTISQTNTSSSGNIELMFDIVQQPCDDKCKADRIINVKTSNGSKPLVSQKITMLRESASKLGSDFSMMDYHYFVIHMLYLVEYADYNFDSKLTGNAGFSKSSSYTLGGTDSLGMQSGYLESNSSSYAIYRGIEDFFFEEEAIDGINIKDNYAYINYDFTTYLFDKYDGNYKIINYNLGDENSGDIKLGYDSNNSLISIFIGTENISGSGLILFNDSAYSATTYDTTGTSRLIRHQTSTGRNFGVPQGEDWTYTN